MRPKHDCVTLRPRHPGDGHEIERLAALGFSAFARRPRRTVRRLITASGARTFVAESDLSGVVGFVVVSVERVPAFGPWDNPALAHLDAIAVDPRRRRRGLAQALLALAERRARERGAVSMSLLTAQSNRAARRLFRSQGYIDFVEAPGFYRDGLDAIRMFKPLG